MTTRPRTVADCCAAGRLPVGNPAAASASSNESPSTRTGPEFEYSQGPGTKAGPCWYRHLMMAAVLAMLLASGAAPPEAGVSESLARERAAAIRDLRYELDLQVPAARGTAGDRAVCGSGFRSRPPDASCWISRGRARPFAACGWTAATARVRGRERPPRRRLRGGRGARAGDRVRGRRRGAEPQRRVPLHAVRAGAGPPDVSLLRPARPQGALHVDAHRARRLAGGEQRRHAARR